MNICILGNGLISLTLAQTLINNNFKVFIYYENNKKISSKNRTIGVTSDNLDFFQKEIIKINKDFIWQIDEIEVYDEKNKKEKILNFQKNKKLFSIIKYNNLYELLNNSLKKSNNFKKNKINNKSFYYKIFKQKKFDLLINCDEGNLISKKYFYKKIMKSYESIAYVTLINHDKTINKKAMQIFTKYGPLAYLPVSETQTSIVYSIKNKSINNCLRLSDANFKNLILENNKNYKINSINKFETFKLNSKILRNYYSKNILAFGEMLHQIHPLAGQGYNMSLRDIRVLLYLIKDKKNLGLTIDTSIYKEFEDKTKHLNFIFALGNDFIYEFFNYDNFYTKFFSKKIFSYVNNNKIFNKLVINYADRGLRV